MKKLFVTMLVGMVFVVGKAHAQEDMPDTTLVSAIDNTETLAANLVAGQVVPVMGRSNFAKRHYIYQRLDISTIVGKDKDSQKGEADDDDVNSSNPSTPDVIAGLNYGLNLGYSLVFVPGMIKEECLELNRFGFAYSTGFVSSFDRQESYGVTCDFLAKLGVETGNGHAIGLGLDALFGGGKSPGTFYFFEGENLSEPNHYTSWCFKYGAQLWLNTSFLSTGLKNSDILAFVRYVRSVDSSDDIEGIYNILLEEAWQFGVTFQYKF